MSRDKVLKIRVSDDERVTIQGLAREYRLTVPGLIRMVLLDHMADERPEIVKRPRTEAPQPAKEPTP